MTEIQAPALGGQCRCSGIFKILDDQSFFTLCVYTVIVDFRVWAAYVPGQDSCECLYFIVWWMLAHAFWSLLLTSYPNALCLQLLVVSDLFTERTQFEMMYLTLTELRRVHPAEDEILIQYLVPATCKAAAVLGMVSERRCGGRLVLAACCGRSLGLGRSDVGRGSSLPFRGSPRSVLSWVSLGLGLLYPFALGHRGDPSP